MTNPPPALDNVRVGDGMNPGILSCSLNTRLGEVAAISGEEPTAMQAAATEHLSVSSSKSLQRAAQLMAEYGVSHLIVLDASSGEPVGGLSTLDIAYVYAH